ncbi:MAG TPA: prepilin-type N-terminal cleavage/methylation domain-containing protein [Deltaproteobacteria bacterium]|nr:prepilin-type N-terminal cleavage/methylation domain-containing protein [Deltaproteobacteria bacterium]HPJ93041.1 prepilin-type N-terminal cleavage/methylation domain-containing protein [Deltaproteobacteria bacterium]HPR50703.1 prepilin-type N-terminal cleavage/methylation domain-containing protein [Deltaproteobacteria bacterium]
MGRGFTLIEVLIAMLVLAISFLWLLKAETQGIDMSVRSKFITTSTLLAQERITEITSGEETITTGSDQGDFGEEYAGYTYTEEIEPTPLEGYYKYTLNIIWGQGGNLETQFVSYLSVP